MGRSRRIGGCKAGLFDRADQFAVQNPQHSAQIAAAFENLAIHADDRIHPLFATQFWTFLNPVDRMFGGASKHGKYGDIFEKRHAIIAPFARGHHPAIQSQDRAKFLAIKGDPVVLRRGAGKGSWCIHVLSLVINLSEIKETHFTIDCHPRSPYCGHEMVCDFSCFTPFLAKVLGQNVRQSENALPRCYGLTAPTQFVTPGISLKTNL